MQSAPVLSERVDELNALTRSLWLRNEADAALSSERELVGQMVR